MISKRVISVALAIVATSFSALAQDAIKAPAQKPIGSTKSEMVPSLIVMNARGASLDGDTLTLSGVAPNSIIFADRPVRAAGHALTSHLLQEWQPGEGDDGFATTPLSTASVNC